MTHTNSSLLVSAIVPCLNEKYFIKNFFNNITLQHFDFKLEVIVSDGGSDDGTIEVLKELQTSKFSFKYILHNDQFVSYSLNKAILKSNGTIIIRMDVHTQYEKHYIANCVNAIQANDAQCVGGPWRACYNNIIQESIALAFQSKLSAGGALSRDLNYKGYVDTVYLGCWYKSDLLKFGLFDEKLVRNQDDELCHRICSQGGLIFQDPSIISYYYPRSSLIRLFHQYFQYGFWRFNSLLKKGNKKKPRHFLPIALLFATFSNVFILFTSQYKLSIFYFLIYFLSFGLTILRKSNFLRIHILTLSIFSIFIMHHSYGLGFITSFFAHILNMKFNFASKLTR
ncbi:glycosyltransferase family 2 protein [Opitutales bacterium]|nr:glycosyltransferase family 2 protein [Opitutales bacterium]